MPSTTTTTTTTTTFHHPSSSKQKASLSSDLEAQRQNQRTPSQQYRPYSDQPPIDLSPTKSSNDHDRYYDQPASQLPRDHTQSSEPAPGETAEQHALHAHIPPTKHWGLDRQSETILFYCIAVPSWGAEIAAAAVASYKGTPSYPFIGLATGWLFLWAVAWLQTAVAMVQRASWVRDESNLKDRRQFLYLSVRLNRLMLPTAIIAFVTFLVAYTQRDQYKDLAYWLLFLLLFILNTVGCVMNAYNNIGWESERLHYEEGEPPMKYTRLAMLGIPS